jgi:hypothetical protein
LLHLIAHYELGNFELLEYLTKSGLSFYGKNAKPEFGRRGDVQVSFAAPSVLGPKH